MRESPSTYNLVIDQNHHENLKKILDAYLDEIMKADLFMGHEINRDKVKFTISMFETGKGTTVMLIAMAIFDTEENGRSKYTERCLESLANTVDWNRHRISITDNNSCEETKLLIDKYAQKLTGKTGIIVNTLTENIGTAEAINLAIRERNEGEVVCKTDNDVVWNTLRWADKLEDTILADPTLGILGLKRKDIWQHVNHEDPKYRTHFDGKLELCPDIMGTCTAFSPALLDKVGFMRQVGLYGGDDVIFSVLSEICGFRNAFLPHIDIDHIDVGGDAYCEQKKRMAGEMLGEMSILIEQYRSGELSVYYNPFE